MRKTGKTTTQNLSQKNADENPHINDLLSKLRNEQLAALSDLPEDVYNNSEEERRHHLHVDNHVCRKMHGSCPYITMSARKK